MDTTPPKRSSGRAAIIAASISVGVAVLGGLGIWQMVRGVRGAIESVQSSRYAGKAGPVVEGAAFKYRIRTAGTGWFLRKDADAKKDNPLADRWLTQPIDDAHVMII